jgi:hypothetical protein
LIVGKAGNAAWDDVRGSVTRQELEDKPREIISP